jgi:hypothetical protein
MWSCYTFIGKPKKLLFYSALQSKPNDSSITKKMNLGLPFNTILNGCYNH